MINASRILYHFILYSLSIVIKFVHLGLSLAIRKFHNSWSKYC